MELQPLGSGVSIYVSKNHRYGTDALLLADFASVGKNGKVCDLGTGCGIIPLLWCRDGFAGKVYGVDIMEEAVKLCHCSLEENGFADRFYPVQADLKQIKQSCLGGSSFDVVTMNPPYKKAGSGVVSENEALSAAKNEILCTLEDIISAADYLLKYGGRLCLCSRPERLTDTICYMRSSKIEPKRLRMVSQRPGREPNLFLIEGKKGGKPGLKVLPQLYIEDLGGGWSQEMKKIYGEFGG